MCETNEVRLRQLLGTLHDELAHGLGLARKTIWHSGTKGDVSEGRWVDMLRAHLPSRYQVNKAFVIDSNGAASEQIDVVIHDRQYSPFVLKMDNALFVPAESVYAVFEVKQNMDAGQIEYAAKKVASVRRLHRTSIPIKHAGGEHPLKKPGHILGGLLCLESDWKPPFGAPFREAIVDAPGGGRLDLGCAVTDGVFEAKYHEKEPPLVSAELTDKSLALFVLRLIARLQDMATVPCLDVLTYARCIETKSAE